MDIGYMMGKLSALCYFGSSLFWFVAPPRVDIDLCLNDGCLLLCKHKNTVMFFLRANCDIVQNNEAIAVLGWIGTDRKPEYSTSKTRQI